MEYKNSCKESLGSPAKTVTRLLHAIQKLAEEIHPGHSQARPVMLDSSLDRDLGLDSLARMELLVRIEKSFGISLPERVIADAETPRDLLRSILGAGTPRLFDASHEAISSNISSAQTVPHGAQTLVEVLKWHVQAHPDRPHIRLYSDEDEDEALTYLQLWEGSAALAGGLQQRGLQLGEPVAIMLPTGRDYFFAFWGILLAGGVPVPIYPPARSAHIEDHLRRHQAILDNSGAATLITVPGARRFVRLLKSQVRCLRDAASLEEVSVDAGTYQEPMLGGQDMAFLQYTSGSTGNPKGVILTHANLLANIRAMGDAVQVKATDVFVSWLPLYHDMGLIGAWLGSLYHALPLVIMSPLAFLARPQRWLWAIHRHRATLSASPNFGYELCLKRLENEDLSGLDLSSWRAAFNGAEPVSPNTIQRFYHRFSRYGLSYEALMPVYGLAECSVGLAIPPPGRGPVIDRIQREPFLHYGHAVPAGDAEPNALSFVAAGRPLPGHEIRVVDRSGRELPERQEGHLQFRGPSATSGYIHNPEQTRQLFQGDWLNSGDLAYIAQGDVYISGRSKDIIIRGGRNVYPQELEEAVGNLPGIRKGNVVAFGTTDPTTGTERLVILAETYEAGPQRLDELRAAINGLATDLLGIPPDDIKLATPKTLLKTSSGKIRRAANRELYERGLIGKPHRAPWLQVAHLMLTSLSPTVRRLKRIVSEALYASYSWFLFVLLAPLAWLAVMVLPSLSWRWAFVRGAALLLSKASCTPLSVQGLENVRQQNPCVLVANHASYIDSLVLAAALPQELSFVAKAELAQRASMRLPLQRLRTEFVERFDKQKGMEDAMRLGQKVRAGQTLVVFAEGTFSRMPGLLPFHMGAFVAAEEGSVPVIPIAIRGTRSILRADSWFPRRGFITITIGQPIEAPPISAEGEADAWARALRLRDAARKHILQYCGEPDLQHEKSPV